MNLIHWNRPSSIAVRRGDEPFSSLQKEINSLFENFFSGYEVPSLWNGNGGGNLTPSVDIIENDKGFKVEAELPGMKSDDVEVSINDNYLTIKGEKKESKEDKGENYLRRERYYGSYQRTIALPETADADKAKATFKKGVLWLEIPKKAEAKAKSRKLEVKEAA